MPLAEVSRGSVRFVKGPFDTVTIEMAYEPSWTTTIKLRTGETLCVDYSAVDATLVVTASLDESITSNG